MPLIRCERYGGDKSLGCGGHEFVLVSHVRNGGDVVVTIHCIGCGDDQTQWGELLSVQAVPPDTGEDSAESGTGDW